MGEVLFDMSYSPGQQSNRRNDMKTSDDICTCSLINTSRFII